MLRSALASQANTPAHTHINIHIHSPWYVGIRKTFVLTYVTSSNPRGLAREVGGCCCVCWLPLIPQLGLQPALIYASKGNRKQQIITDYVSVDNIKGFPAGAQTHKAPFTTAAAAAVVTPVTITLALCCCCFSYCYCVTVVLVIVVAVTVVGQFAKGSALDSNAASEAFAEQSKDFTQHSH